MGLNNPPVSGALTYTPALQGATDNPTPTYALQQGRYFTIGKLCYVKAQVTTSTMTKTTLTDQIRLTLPIAAANVSSDLSHLHARVENGTAVLNGVVAETSANNSYTVFRNLPLAAASALLTYGLTSLGVLTNTITIVISGWYETV